MAFRQGTPWQPGKLDTGMLQYAANSKGQAGAAIGQGLMALGGAFKEKKEQQKAQKDIIKAAEPWLKAVSTMEQQLPPGMLAQLDGMSAALKDEDTPLSQRAAMAGQIVQLSQGLVGAGMKSLAGSMGGGTPGQHKGFYSVPGRDKPVEGIFRPDHNRTYMWEKGTLVPLPEGSEPYSQPKEFDMGMENFQTYVNMNPESGQYGAQEQFGTVEGGKNAGQVGRVVDGEFVPRDEDWVMLSAVEAASPTPENYDEKREALLFEEEGKRKLNQLKEARQHAGTGVDYLKNRLGGIYKTVLGGKEKLTPSELAAGEASKRLQSAIGAFRNEIVGPGIVTEFDAKRIEDALGGALTTGNFEVAEKLLGDIMNEKERKAAFLRNQLEAARRANPAFRGEYFALPDPYSPTPTFQTEEEALKSGVKGEVIINGRKATIK